MIFYAKLMHMLIDINSCMLKISSINFPFSKWKKTQIDGNAPVVNKVVDFISTSLYINPKSERQRLVKPHITTDRWHQYLQQGLETFSINEEPFQFGMMVNFRQETTLESLSYQ